MLEHIQGSEGSLMDTVSILDIFNRKPKQCWCGKKEYITINRFKEIDITANILVQESFCKEHYELYKIAKEI